MEQSRNLHPILAVTVQEKMARRFHTGRSHSSAAERQVECSGTVNHNLRSFRRAWAVRVFAEIAERLKNKGLVSERRSLAELLAAAFQY